MQAHGIIPRTTSDQFELAFWNSIKDSSHAGDYEVYLKAYPKGRFAPLAQARIARLRTAPAPVRNSGEIRDCQSCAALVSFPGGIFTMGNSASDASERPAHQVTIAAPFAIGEFEITVQQWKACVTPNGCPQVVQPPIPVQARRCATSAKTMAQRYVKWLGLISGRPYRLPTEAEWEFAARGGTASPYRWGQKMVTGYANCKECGPPWSSDRPANAESFPPNPYGVHDTSGSVWEWVADCWHSKFKDAPADGTSTRRNRSLGLSGRRRQACVDIALRLGVSRLPGWQ